jgi:hypothetical protein
MHRLEHVGGSIGDLRHAARRLQATPLSENPITTETEVTSMTIFSSVDTVRRFNMVFPQICAHLEGKR